MKTMVRENELTFVILALSRLRQGDYELEANLGYHNKFLSQKTDRQTPHTHTSSISSNSSISNNSFRNQSGSMALC